MSNDLDYRSWGATRNCKGCRNWSEMLASFDGGGLRAACLSATSPNAGKMTLGFKSCESWEEGSLGAIDSPGGDPYDFEDGNGDDNP